MGKKSEPSEKALQLTKTLKENSIHPEQEENKDVVPSMHKRRVITAIVLRQEPLFCKESLDKDVYLLLGLSWLQARGKGRKPKMSGGRLVTGVSPSTASVARPHPREQQAAISEVKETWSHGGPWQEWP